MKTSLQAPRLVLGAFLSGSVALSTLACEEDSTEPPENGAGGSAGTANPGNGGTGNGSSPPLFSPAATDDDELARRALELLGSAAVGAEGSCRTCHSLGRPTLTRWSALTRDFATECLEDTALSDAAEVDAMVECFRGRSSEPSGAFTAQQFGIYAAAAHLPWFSYVFENAAEFDGDWRAEHAAFVERVGMPRAGRRWTQAEFDQVAEWFDRGLPGLFALVPEETGQDCTPGLAPTLAAHVAEMQESGWRARNAEVPLLMFGCDEGQVGLDCLTAFELARDTGYGSDWDIPGTQIRILHDNSSTLSTYWSRTSADGRYIGSGLLDSADFGYSGQILDLEREATISVNFSYDATFFPDNSGFLVQQGGGSSSGAAPGMPSDGSANGDTSVICEQSLLTDGPEAISGEEPECSLLSGRIGLYQQLAKSIDGEDYWVIHGSYEGDDGGFSPVHGNPSAAFENDSTSTLTPMVNQGNGFEPGDAVRVETPGQGDPMLSPSGRLLVTRAKGFEYTTNVDGFEVVAAEQSGYALYRVEMTRTGETWSASLEDLGRICLQGGKAVFSYDERWMVFHHYVIEADAGDLGFSDASDPGFSEYTELGAANLYLVDLLSGETERITNVSPGQYALFPHFRSDGWIYFVVRTLEGEEYFAASDAALVREIE